MPVLLHALAPCPLRRKQPAGDFFCFFGAFELSLPKREHSCFWRGMLSPDGGKTPPKGGSKMDELNTKYRDLLKELASQASERQAELAWIFLSGLIARNA